MWAGGYTEQMLQDSQSLHGLVFIRERCTYSLSFGLYYCPLYRSIRSVDVVPPAAVEVVGNLWMGQTLECVERAIAYSLTNIRALLYVVVGVDGACDGLRARPELLVGEPV